MSSSDTIIRVDRLSKQYRLGKRRPYKTMRESLVGAVTSPFRRLAGNGNGTDGGPDSFWALKDVSFEVKQGDVVGIIGRNGAGKSTLLKVLSRITEPTDGEVELFGRVGSLLEVGTGFHPELTGRENIYLNGAILGMRRSEITDKFDEIVAFAETEKFLDTPVKHYSSGMYTRLAFAVAAHLEPEILIVDEVLAVGDAAFQKKCLGKMKDVAGQGRTVIFVSHQMNAVRALCNQCVMLCQGEVERTGPSAEVVDYYMADAPGASSEWRNDGTEFADAAFVPMRFAAVDAEGRTLVSPVGADEPVRVAITGQVLRPHVALNVGIAVYAMSGELLFWSVSTDRRPDEWPTLRGSVTLTTKIPPHLLNEGVYRIELIVSMHHIEWISEPGRNAPAISVNVHGGLSESPYWMAARPGLLAPVLPFDARPNESAV